MPARSGCIAQLVEQLTLNQRAGGSNPSAPTTPFQEVVWEIASERGATPPGSGGRRSPSGGRATAARTAPRSRRRSRAPDRDALHERIHGVRGGPHPAHGSLISAARAHGGVAQCVAQSVDDGGAFGDEGFYGHKLCSGGLRVVDRVPAPCQAPHEPPIKRTTAQARARSDSHARCAQPRFAGATGGEPIQPEARLPKWPSAKARFTLSVNRLLSPRAYFSLGSV